MSAPRIAVPWGALLAFAAMLGCARSAASQVPEISVEARGSQSPRVDPGKVVTAVYRVGNRSSTEVSLRPSVMAPPEWQVLAGEAALPLEPGASTAWIVSVMVPTSAMAGEHSAVVTLRSSSGQALFEDSLAIFVEELPRVQVLLLGAPSYAISGDSLSVSYQVRNLGNAAGVFRSEALAVGELERKGTDSVFSLRPGEVLTRTARFAAVRNLERSTSARVEVRVMSLGPAATADTGAVEIVVIPRPDLRRDQFHEVPARARVSAGRGGITPLLAEVAGKGPLLERGGATVDFHFRGRTGADHGMGERDQYSLGFHDESFEIQAGDHYFSLSPLTGSGREGFGLGGSFTAGSARSGGFVQRDRRSSGGDAQVAAFAALTLPDSGTLGAQLAWTHGTDPGTLATLRWEGSPAAGTTLDAEYGIGRGPRGSGDGISVDLRGSQRIYSYALSHRSGDAALPGIYGGTQNSYASLDVRAASFANFGGHASRFSRSSRQRATEPGWFLPTDNHSAGVRADLFNQFSVEYRWQESALQASPFAITQWSEEALRLRVTPRYGRLSVTTGVDLGTWREAATSEQGRFTEYTVTPFVATTGGQSFSGYLTHRRGRSRYGSGGDTARWSGGMSAFLQLPGDSRLQLSAQDQAPLHDLGERERRIRARIERRLSGGRILSLEIQRLTGGYQGPLSPTTLKLEYSVPLQVPVGRAHPPGRVMGRVTDGETGTPLGGAVVRLADQFAVSDPAGYVVFRGIAAGQHRLLLSPRGDVAQRVAVGDSMIEVGEGPGAAGLFHLSLLRGGRVRGSVRRLAFTELLPGRPNADSLVDAGGLQNIVVALASGADTMRLVTDPHGNFDAGELRPGRWTLAYEGGGLPARHTIANSPVEFSVARGGDARLALLVRPQRRTVRMVATGELVSRPAEPAAAPPPPPPTAPPSAPAAAPGGGDSAPPPGDFYTVRAGDCLSDIALAVYGDAGQWKRIWAANRDHVPDPDRIRPEQRLSIPPRGARVAASGGHRAPVAAPAPAERSSISARGQGAPRSPRRAERHPLLQIWRALHADLLQRRVEAGRAYAQIRDGDHQWRQE